MTLKAIDTRYKGHLFRSRLEARWAVFFDHLGIAWEYEPEGFELPSGRYLPDFRTTSSCGSFRYWVEVKGEDPTEREKSILLELANLSDIPAYMVHGLPGERPPLFLMDLHVGALSGLRSASFVANGVGLVISGSRLDDMIANAIVAAKSARFEHGFRG